MAGLSARRTAGVVVLLGVSTVALGLPIRAGAQDVSIEIPLNTVVRGEEGSEHVLASEEVPADLVGSECSVTAVATNQRSVHPGNDLVVSSSGDQVVLEDVEGEAFGERTAEGSLTLGTELTVTLILGPDGRFSAGIDVEVLCPGPETTTTTTTEPTVPTSSTTLPETTTTTVAETTTSEVLGTTTSTDITTTTAGETTTTTTGATSTTPSTLPFTGLGAGSATIGLAALMMGAGLIALTGRTGDGGRGLGGAGYTEVIIEGIRVKLLRPGD